MNRNLDGLDHTYLDCEGCRNPVPNNSIFCPRCGVPMKAVLAGRIKRIRQMIHFKLSTLTDQRSHKPERVN
jgi:hypothetical protein